MSDWDDYAESWDQNPDVIAYANKAFNTLTNEINLTQLNILDFGCGTGLLTNMMAKSAANIVAIDSSEKMVAVLADKNITNLDCLCATIDKDWIENNVNLHSSFDVITASSVLAFVDDYEETVSLLKKLLKPGGKLVHWDWLKSDMESGFGLTEIEINKAFAQTQWAKLTVSYPFTMTSNDNEMGVVMVVAQK